MAQHELLVKLGLQSDSFTRNLKNVNNQLKLTDAEFNKLKASSTNFGSSQKDLESKLKSLSSTKEKLTAKTLLYKNKINDLNGEIEKASTKHKEITTRLEAEKKKLMEIELLYGKSTKAYKEQAKVVKDVQAEYDKSKKKIETLNLSLQKHKIALTDTETALEKVKRAINDTKFDKMTLSLTNASQKLDSVSKKLDSVSQKFTNLGRSLTMGVSAPIIGAGTSIVKFTAEFEASMDKVKALSKSSAEDMALLEAKAREMGKATSFTAKEAADGLGYMALAGWKTEDMLKGIEPVLRLAEAGGHDLATTSDLVTDSMSSLGLTTADLTDYLDKVALAASESNTEIDQMLRTYNQVGGSLKRFNVPLEESGALIGVLANRGLKAEQAGRSLSSIMINLIKPTGESAKALKKLGVSAYDSKGKFKGVENVLKELKAELYKTEKGTQKYTDAQRDAYLAMIGGKTQIRTLDALLAGVTETTANGKTEFQNLKNELLNSEGALQEMATTMKDNVQGDWERFTSAVGELALKIGETLKPAIRDILQKFTDFVNKLSEMDESTLKYIVKLALMAAAIGPALLVLGGLTKSLSAVTKAFSTGLSGMVKFAKKAWDVFNAVKKGASLFTALSTAASSAIAVIGASVAVFAGVAAVLGENETILATLQEKWGTFGLVVSSTCEHIAGVFQMTIGNLLIGLGTLGKAIIKAITFQWGDIDNVVSEGWAKIEKNSNKALDNMTMSSTAAIYKMRNMTSSELSGLTKDMEFILSELPNVTYDTANSAAEKFAQGLQNLNNDSIAILSSTSETMNMLFRGIHENMSNKEATEQYRKNLEVLSKTGGVSVDELKREIDKTLNLINNNMADSGERFSREAKVAMDKFNAVTTQGVDKTAGDIASHLAGLNTVTITELQNVGNNWSAVFRNIKTDGTMNTEAMVTTIEDNIRRMAKNNPKFVEQLRAEMNAHFEKMPQDASNNLMQLATEVSTGSQNVVNASVGTGQQVEQNLSFDASGKTLEEITGMQNTLLEGAIPVAQAAANIGDQATMSYANSLQGLDTTTMEKMQSQANNIQQGGAQSKAAMEQNAISSIEGFISSWDANSGRINESIEATFQNMNRLTKFDWSLTNSSLDSIATKLTTVSSKADSTRASLSAIAQVSFKNASNSILIIRDGLSKITNTAKSANKSLLSLSNVKFNSGSISLNTLNAKLKTTSNLCKPATAAMKKLAEVKFDKTNDALGKTNSHLTNASTKANTAKSSLVKLSEVGFSGLVSRLNSVASTLSTIVSRASSAASKVRSISASVPRVIAVPTMIPIATQNFSDKIGFLSRDAVDLSPYNVTKGYLSKERSIADGITGASVSANAINNNKMQDLMTMLLKQQELIVDLLSAGKELVLDNTINIDGRQVAKSTARYMETEMNNINNRKKRLGGR